MFPPSWSRSKYGFPVIAFIVWALAPLPKAPATCSAISKALDLLESGISKVAGVAFPLQDRVFSHHYLNEERKQKIRTSRREKHTNKKKPSGTLNFYKI